MPLIENLARHATETIRLAQPALSETAAVRLLHVHVDPRFYSMPIHSRADEQALITLCKGNEDLASVDEILHLENTATIWGVVRVMARTHLNRSGINDISMGSPWKTMSPRVLRLFDRAPSEAILRDWLSYAPMIDAWVQIALRFPGEPSVGNFDESDLQSLRVLQELTAQQAKHMPGSLLPPMDKPNWARAVLGVYTGLLFLSDRYGYVAENVWAEIGHELTPQEIRQISRSAQESVREYGPALAPSFFADLGSAYFVKPDTHVVDVATWARGNSAKATPTEAVEFVNQVARDTGLAPRTVDKYMFLACSGNMYLAGIDRGSGLAAGRKRELERSIREITDYRR